MTETDCRCLQSAYAQCVFVVFQRFLKRNSAKPSSSPGTSFRSPNVMKKAVVVLELPSATLAKATANDTGEDTKQLTASATSQSRPNVGIARRTRASSSSPRKPRRTMGMSPLRHSPRFRSRRTKANSSPGLNINTPLDKALLSSSVLSADLLPQGLKRKRDTSQEHTREPSQRKSLHFASAPRKQQQVASSSATPELVSRDCVRAHTSIPSPTRRTRSGHSSLSRRQELRRSSAEFGMTKSVTTPKRIRGKSLGHSP